MKIPHTIDLNTLETYKSPLKCEERSKICSANLEWNSRHPEKLTELCIRKIADNWRGLAILSGRGDLLIKLAWQEYGDFPHIEIPLTKDRNFLLEILDTNLPLNLLAEHIPDDAFWKRAYRERWPGRIVDEKRPFIQLFMEAHSTEELEQMHPRSYDPEKISELVKLWSDHVRHLSIRSMIPADPPHVDGADHSAAFTADWIDQKEDIGKTAKQYFKSKAKAQYRDHIPLSGVLSSLPFLSEIHLTFGLRSAGPLFRKDLFQLTPVDVRHLCRGLEKCPQLKILRVTLSELDCGKLKSLLKSLGDNHGIRTLDFSHCKIADSGALILSKFIIKHPALKELILVNNKIGLKGAEGIGYALSHPASRLLTLNLRMNSYLGSPGASLIASALLRGSVLQNLNLSACGITREAVEGAADCGQLIASAVAAGRSPIRDLDLSVNDLGLGAGAALATAMESIPGGGGPASLSVRAAGCGRWEAVIARAALRNAGRRRAAALRFRKGAARLLAATRVARAIGIMAADPIDLAKHLTARPSNVSIMSIDSEALNVSLPEAGEFEPFNFNIPPLKNPLPTSPASSVTETITSRRSSYHGSTHQAPIEVKEVRRSALVRRSSVDGSLLQGTRSADSQRRIKIFVSATSQAKKSKEKA